MTVVSVKPGIDPEIVRIEFSGGSLFSFKTSYIPLFYRGKALYSPGKELSPDEEGAIFFAAACYRAERIALRLVARAEQTAFNLARKLERRGHSPSSVRAVISRLQELGILEDARYAELWIRSRLARRAESPRSLTAALRSRGIDKNDVRSALKSALQGENEWILLQRYLEKNRLSPKETPSLAYRLKVEGFSPSLLDRLREEGDF
ncbi:MAG: recombination regulator RecX [Treponema sp.]|jgi:regulatory protein|nr:recombination regulator RecX [Treponema sp.]